MKKRKLMLLAVTMSIILTAATASAGVINFAPITSDADSGISADITYTHALDFTNGSAGLVNGVQFALGAPGDFPEIGVSSQTVGTGSTTSPNDPGRWDDGNVPATGDIRQILAGFMGGTVPFVSGGSGTVVTLTGLRPLQTYKFRFYNRSWANNAGGNRLMEIGFVTDGVGTELPDAVDTAKFDEDNATLFDPGFGSFNQVYALEYTYKLPVGVTTLRVVVKALNENYHMYALTNEVIDGMDPDPEDGFEEVPAGPSVSLSWTNVDPNAVVDVWFGTDPCMVDGTWDMVGTVDADGDERSSFNVDAPDIGEVYFWMVDSKIPDANNFEGNLYSFTTVADPAPTIDGIIPDQATWTGEGVPLYVNVDNNVGGAETMYQWVADPADDVTIIDGGTATPTVTITKTPVLVPYVTNGSFEEGHSSWTDADAGSDTWVPGVDAYDEGHGPVGETVMWVNGVGSITQQLTETLVVGATYELSVQVANNNYYSNSGYKVELMAGDNVLAMDSASLDDSNAGQFATSIVDYTYVPEDANKVGLPMTIRMGCTVPFVQAIAGEINFDDVKLLINGEPGTYEIPSIVTVTMTVIVNDEGSDVTDEASIEIDVYDDACHLARDAEGLDDLNDLNKNCVVDIGDFAMMAATWLSDTALTDPATK